MEEQSIIKENYVRQSETIGKIALALSKAQNEFNKAISDNTNPFYKSKYADLSTIINATREALSLHEIALIQFVSGDVNKVSVTTRICHSSGEWLESTISGKPAKQDCQQQGAVATYLRRYAQAGILNIAQEDDDYESGMNRNQKPETISPLEMETLANLMHELSEPTIIKKMFDAFKIKELGDLPKKNFQTVMTTLKKRIELKNKQ